MKFTAAIIGLGQIGSQYDQGQSSVPRSHLAALLQNPHFQISALVDLNVEAIQNTKKSWPQIADTPSFGTIKEWKKETVDVVVISTPASHRLEIVEMALEKKIKLLVVEKPLALNTTEGRAILKAAKDKNVLIRVNFPRRFDPEYLKVREEMGSEIPEKIVMRYGKGLFNYASHHVDLLQDWFGKIESAKLVGEAKSLNPSFICKMQSGFEAFILGLDNLEYDQFETQIFLQNRYIELLNGGCEKTIRNAQMGIYYPGYTQMASPKFIGSPGPVNGMAGFYAAVANWFEKGGALAGCDGETALSGLEILESIERERTK